MTEPYTASDEDITAVEPVIRRVVASRVDDPHDVDDLVHDCLERLLRARHRLAPDIVLPVAVVTARNLTISRARTASRRARSTHRLLEVQEVRSPEDEFLAGEVREAMATALHQLSAAERTALLAYQDVGTKALGSGPEISAGAMRVRMARTRVKLRLEYLLAFRHVSLPTPACKGVLLSVSGGDTRRQRALGAGDHLLNCDTCAALSEVLERRSVALTALAFPLAAAGWAAGKARAHPVSTAAGTAATGAAAAVVVTSLLAPGPQPRPPQAPVAATTTAPAPTIPGLTVRGAGLHPNSTLRAEAGQVVTAHGVSVQSVVTHNGFWVGASPAVRIWVELVGPLRPLRIVRGDRLRFKGKLSADKPSYPRHVGVNESRGAPLLTTEGVHISVDTRSVVVESRARPRG